MKHTEGPFGTIESAQEYLSLLSQGIDEAADEVREALTVCTDRKEARRGEAWRLVLYTLTKLSSHVTASRRLLNDLRTLRNLLQRQAGVEPAETEVTVTAAVRSQPAALSSSPRAAG
jgi:hypothetical protein